MLRPLAKFAQIDAAWSYVEERALALHMARKARLLPEMPFVTAIAQTGPNSFLVQRLHRVDIRGTRSRQPHSQQRHGR